MYFALYSFNYGATVIENRVTCNKSGPHVCPVSHIRWEWVLRQSSHCSCRPAKTDERQESVVSSPTDPYPSLKATASHRWLILPLRLITAVFPRVLVSARYLLATKVTNGKKIRCCCWVQQDKRLRRVKKYVTKVQIRHASVEFFIFYSDLLQITANSQCD